MAKLSKFLAASAAALLLSQIGTANASLIDLGPGSFTPGAPVIDFSTPGVGTINPTYTFGSQVVSFGAYFVGQAVTGGFPVTLSDNTPSGPLTLATDPNQYSSIRNDGAPGATSPILSGIPLFNGPIAILFAQPVAAVGLKGGYFDAIGATTIEAYAADGSTLGSIVNSTTGFEFYGLFDTEGSNIAGVSFYITGNEPAGFEIDNVTFGDADVVRVPEPATLALLAIAGLAATRRRRQ